MPTVSAQSKNGGDIEGNWKVLHEVLLSKRPCSPGLVKKLLNELAIDDDLFVELVKNPGGPSWRGEQLDLKLRQHLGSKYSLYQAFIEDMASAVKELTRRLEIDDQGKVCPLKALGHLRR